MQTKRSGGEKSLGYYCLHAVITEVTILEGFTKQSRRQYVPVWSLWTTIPNRLLHRNRNDSEPAGVVVVDDSEPHFY